MSYWTLCKCGHIAQDHNKQSLEKDMFACDMPNCLCRDYDGVKVLDKDLLTQPSNAGQKWIRPMLLGSGWAAVMMWINNEEEDDVAMGLFPEPFDSGILRYETKQEAANEAFRWARDEQIPVFLDGCERPK